MIDFLRFMFQKIDDCSFWVINFYKMSIKKDKKYLIDDLKVHCDELKKLQECLRHEEVIFKLNMMVIESMNKFRDDNDLDEIDCKMIGMRIEKVSQDNYYDFTKKKIEDLEKIIQNIKAQLTYN